MRTILACLVLLLFQSNAWSFDKIINCSSTALTTSYSTAQISGVNLPPKPTFAIMNASSVRICANTDTGYGASAPTAGAGDEHCVPPNTSLVFPFINATLRNASVYVRADQASCSSGFVDVDIW